MNRLLGWLQQLWHVRTRWLGMWAGVILWLVWMIFGFWATILLVILAVVGFVVGRVLEANESWKEIVQRLLSEHYGD